MGIFDKFTNKVTTENQIDWNALTELKQLDTIVSESADIPVVIFKHSTHCGISRMALRGFEADYNYPGNEIKAYFLDLLRYRDVSNAIADKFGVIHQSPQLLLIKDGDSIFDTSHGDINASALRDKI
jgi:bacillithiol system protein YtxJ